MENIKCDYHLPKMLINVLDQHPEPYCIKNVDSVYVYANSPLAKLIGLRTPKDFLHKSEFEINSRLTENEDVVREWQYQDRVVFESKKNLQVLEVHPNAIVHPYLVVKIPFYDEFNQCIGVLTYGKTLKNLATNIFINRRCTGSLLLDKPDDFFTEKECEMIFWVLQGDSYKSISDKLSLPLRTVESTFQKLYEKVGVSHFDDFSEFCYKNNYNRYLPKRFMENKAILFMDYPRIVE